MNRRRMPLTSSTRLWKSWKEWKTSRHRNLNSWRAAQTLSASIRCPTRCFSRLKVLVSLLTSVVWPKVFIFVFLDDVYDFYMTPVDVQTPYQALVKENNLPNLHIIPEYRRYSPEEDGVSAFPRSSTLVTGLKYRNKYKGHIAKTSWP